MTYNAAVPGVVRMRGDAGKHILFVDQFMGFPAMELARRRAPELRRLRSDGACLVRRDHAVPAVNAFARAQRTGSAIGSVTRKQVRSFGTDWIEIVPPSLRTSARQIDSPSPSDVPVTFVLT